MYEDGIPFNIQQLRDIAYFSNCFCFRAIWENIIGLFCTDLYLSNYISIITDFNQPKAESIFNSLHKLCMLLHNRDSRRSFVPDDKFWLAP